MPIWPRKTREKATVTPPEERLAALERRNAELAADLALLRREWADTLDKLQTWFGRQAARKRQQLHRELEREHQEAAESAAGDAVAPVTANGKVDKRQLRQLAAQRGLGRLL